MGTAMIDDDSGIEKGGGDEKKNSLGWMTTFSDLTTLLLTFFVLLFSMSSMDDKKFESSFRNFDKSTGILSYSEYKEISSPRKTLIEGLHRLLGEKITSGEGEGSDSEDAAAGEIDTMGLEGSGDFLTLKPVREGFKLVFGHKFLFPSGGVAIRGEIEPVLRKIARFITVSGYQVYIDGHTDSTPPSSGQYASNEELSIARAFNVMEYLVRRENISPESIAITGYGALHPVASNKTPEGRAENRRVEIVFKNQRYF
jgi:chemotaxis protein MotB